jgi:hypothetical protein
MRDCIPFIRSEQGRLPHGSLEWPEDLPDFESLWSDYAHELVPHADMIPRHLFGSTVVTGVRDLSQGTWVVMWIEQFATHTFLILWSSGFCRQYITLTAIRPGALGGQLLSTERLGIYFLKKQRMAAHGDDTFRCIEQNLVKVILIHHLQAGLELMSKREGRACDNDVEPQERRTPETVVLWPQIVWISR